MHKHFVNFRSPGTIVAEESSREVDSWSIQLACELAHGISERHGATPYGFYFSTRGRGENDLDSKVIDISRMYYLGGKVETLAEIKARNDPADRILISNMEINGWDRVLVNNNSYRYTLPLKSDDIVLDWVPRKKDQANG